MDDHPENFDFDDEGLDLTDEQRWLLAELEILDVILEGQEAGLEGIADADPVGFIAFADRDDWLDSRLGRGTPPE